MSAEYTPDSGYTFERSSSDLNGREFSPETREMLSRHEGIHAEIVDNGKLALRVSGLFVPEPEVQWKEFEPLVEQFKEEAREQKVDELDFVCEESLTPNLLAKHKGFTVGREVHSRPFVMRLWHARLSVV